MATDQEKEQIIENTAGAEYTRRRIGTDAVALWRGLDTKRRDTIDDMVGRDDAGERVSDLRVFSSRNPAPGNPSRFMPVSPDLNYSNDEWNVNKLRNTALNSFVYTAILATADPVSDADIARLATPGVVYSERYLNSLGPAGSEERREALTRLAERNNRQEALRTAGRATLAQKAGEAREAAKEPGQVDDILEAAFRERVVNADAGGLSDADQVNRLRRTAIFFSQSPSETPSSPAGILYNAKTNFRWAYYTLFARNGSEPAESEVIDYIGLDEIVALFIRSRTNEILHESIDELPEDAQQTLADPSGPQNTRDFQEAQELLGQIEARRVQEQTVPEEDRGSQEIQSQLRRLAEQAFLIDHLPDFAKQNQKIRVPTYLSEDSGAPYFSMIHGRTDTVVNRLMHNPALQQMDLLRPSELAGLVPKIRLFKVFSDTDNAENVDETQVTYEEQEIPFDNYIQQSEIGSMMKNAFDRGRGVGLTSFDWRLEGRDPFTSRRDIFAELKLHFQSFDEILRVRKLGSTDLKSEMRSFRYVDLVNIGVVRQTREGAWNPDYYKLKVDVGWQDPGSENAFLGTRQEREAKRDAVVNSRMVMYLTAIDHSIDVNDQGNVNMSIQYVAWQEASYLDQDSDVLATPELKQRRLERRAQIDRARSRCNEEEVNRIIENYKGVLRAERLNSYQSLLKRLVDEQRIYYVPVPVTSLQRYINFGESGVNTRAVNSVLNNSNNNSSAVDVDFSNVASQSSGQLAQILSLSGQNVSDDTILKKIQDIAYDPSARNLNLQYFFFGDLIKVALEQASTSVPPNAGQNPSAGMVGKLQKDLRILLGPISFKRTLQPVQPDLPAQTEFLYNINLADIPISVSFFGEWLLKQAISEQRTTYPILVFVRDLANKMLSNIMRNQAHGFGNIARQNLQLRSNFFSAAADVSGGDIVQNNFNILPDPRSRAALRQQLGFDTPQDFTRLDVDGIPTSLRPLLRAPNEGERTYHYMLVYAINPGSTERRRGNFTEDNERGIYHFGIGKDRGIFKSVKFSKTDLPFLREGRFQAADAEASATGLTILANVYEIEITMFGNTMFAPGMKVFLNPSGIAPMLGSPAEPYSPANLLGIGGYHDVTGVRSYIQGGKFETTMKAIFVASGARGALGFSGAEQTAGREERCPEEIEAQSLTDSPTPTTRAINQGQGGNN